MIFDDFAGGRLATPTEDADKLQVLLADRSPDQVDYQGWQRIDKAERASGAATGRPRTKLISIESMLAAARSDG